MKRIHWFLMATLSIGTLSLHSCKKQEAVSQTATVAAQQKTIDSLRNAAQAAQQQKTIDSLHNAVQQEQNAYQQELAAKNAQIETLGAQQTTAQQTKSAQPKTASPKPTPKTTDPASNNTVAAQPMQAAPVATPPQPVTNPRTQIDRQLNVYVVATKGQSVQEQDADEASCFAWAKNETGYDPNNPPKIEVSTQNNQPSGNVVRSGAKGAAVGAAVGAIAGDAGKGAAIGATLGGTKGLQQNRQDYNQKQAASQAEADKILQDMQNSFKRAFISCMQGKGYTIN